ncbi:MAG TPA: extensin family protein, partial [Acidocella sp.]|nr:extensin family protein [Acidocella sp.]
MMRVILRGAFPVPALAIALAGCAGMWFAEREPWRRDAELACLQSGAVKEGPTVTIVKAINGPGVCGADYPLQVAAIGGSARLGFADEVVPPPGGDTPDHPHPARAQLSSLMQAAPYKAGASISTAGAYPPSDPGGRRAPTPAAVTPAATLACPMVSMLDRFVSDKVQPAALRWFGQRVVEIKQISAYSCRGMNGDPYAGISEHAFGNALDMAAFTFADGRKITVKDGWHGAPAEQGFLRDIQSAACEMFTTVLAP